MSPTTQLSKKTAVSVLILLISASVLERTYAQIPLSMWVKMRNISATKFIDQFLRQGNQTTPAPVTTPKPDRERPTPPPIFTKGGSISPEGRDQMVTILADDDQCSPRDQSVSTITTDDPNLITWPPCTKVPRCGGCCGNDMLECAPSKIEMHVVTVMRARYPFPGATYFDFEGATDVPLEKHVACTVRCKVQPYHCNPHRHSYDANSCKCRCKNERISGSCTLQQRWDPDQCACVCRKQYLCHDDEIYSNSTCKCELKNDLRQIDSEQVGGSPDSVQGGDPCLRVVCNRGYVGIRLGSTCRCKLDARYGTEHRDTGSSAHLDRMTLDGAYPRRDYADDYPRRSEYPRRDYPRRAYPTDARDEVYPRRRVSPSDYRRARRNRK